LNSAVALRRETCRQPLCFELGNVSGAKVRAVVLAKIVAILIGLHPWCASFVQYIFNGFNKPVEADGLAQGDISNRTTFAAEVIAGGVM